MFDIGSTELLLVAVVAILVIGPKDLPRALYKAGQILGKARGMARHFRTGIDAMIREAELEDLEKKWAAENERIKAQWPSIEDGTQDASAPAAPLAPPPAEEAVDGSAGEGEPAPAVKDGPAA